MHRALHDSKVEAFDIHIFLAKRYIGDASLLSIYISNRSQNTIRL